MTGSRGLVKLFGKTIPVAPAAAGDPVEKPLEEGGDGAAEGRGGGGGGKEGEEVDCKGIQNPTTEFASSEQDKELSRSEEKSKKDTNSAGSEKQMQNPTDQGTEAKQAAEPKEGHKSSTDLHEKTIKKPDKILPCPRCTSMDTKFCYYNNYNVNQPRHFCRNCQRYWTAGGTMRNVPVGAGRRKSKHSANHQRPIAVSEAAFQMIHSDISGQVHNPVLKPNGRVLCFSSNEPSDAVASGLNISEKATNGCNRNMFDTSEKHLALYSQGDGGSAENGEDNSSASSAMASNLTEDGSGTNLQESVAQHCPSYLPQVPYLTGVPWPSPWNGSSALCLSSFPVPIYPTTGFWGCPVPGAWGLPFLAPVSSSSVSTGPSVSSPKTKTLGKHLRERDVLIQNNLEKMDASNQANEERCFWIPKTLRIDDPEEAAKSSIWSMVGIKNDKVNGCSRRELFKAFDQHESGIRNHTAEASKILHANPAALSRSLNFLESS